MSQEEKEQSLLAQQAIYSSIKEVPLDLKVVLVNGLRKIGELVALGPGSVLEFKEQTTTHPAVLYADEQPFAQGSTVSSNEHYAIKITSVLAGNYKE